MSFGRLSLVRSAVLALGLLGSISAASAQSTTIPVDARATYLRTSGDVNSQPAMAIDLEALGLQPGDPVLLERVGYFAYQVPNSTSSPVPPYSDSMVAVFSSTSVLDPSTDPHRVPGAIDYGTDVTTLNSYNGNLSTNIPEDFGVTSAGSGSVTVTIPAGAKYLFVSPNDAYFGDNVSVGYAIRITLLDTDRDGVLDSEDDCVPSDMREYVDTGSGPTSVKNVVDANGCTIQDHVNACRRAATNHGHYVSCIAHLANQLAREGVITNKQKSELISGAAKSDVGK